MSERRVDRTEIERQIRSAFANVALGDGVSLRQAELLDRGMAETPSADALRSARRLDVVDDWAKVPSEELDSECLAFLDAEGLRYYLPALLLSILDDYDPASMRVISTLHALYPKNDDLRAHREASYSLFSEDQRRAVASFLFALPSLVTLERDDGKVIDRALRNYWLKFLDPGRVGA